jgi:hypothetical protein
VPHRNVHGYPSPMPADDQRRDAPQVAEAPSRRLLAKIGHEARTAVISCIVTLIVTIPTMIYTAGARSALDRETVRQLKEVQAADHENQSKLAASLQSLTESVLLLTSKVAQMVPLQVHEARWADIDHQLKAVDSKVDKLGNGMDTVNQNILRLSERVK